jgi:hypothetical protein
VEFESRWHHTNEYCSTASADLFGKHRTEWQAQEAGIPEYRSFAGQYVLESQQ